ncbi:hypothetical protein JCM14469_27030 [Desulfatiferula olefinivorans]
MDIDAFLKKLESIKDLPTLPVIAFQVNRMLMDADTTIHALSETIKKDQAIVSKLLKLVNSAFYGARSQVGTVHEAVVRLGFNSVRNIVISVSVFDAFSISPEQGGGFNIEDFWKHSVGVAIISKYLSDQTGIQDPDDCFVSGLLHDIGLIVLVQYFPEIVARMVARMRDEGISIYEAEKEILPIRHNKIGEMLARKWQLPAGLCDTLKYHHMPIRSAVNPELLTLVHVADIIYNRFAVSSINPKKDNRTPILTAVGADAAKSLEKQFRYAEDWFPDIYEHIKDACRFFMTQ